MCFLRSAWSDCGKNYNRDKSTCSLFRLHASVYLLDSLSACLSVCVHTALFQVSSRGRAERSAAASCLLFFFFTHGGRVFPHKQRAHNGFPKSSTCWPEEKSPLSLCFLFTFSFTFSLLSPLLSLYYLFLRIRAVRSPTWLNSWMAQPLKASMINNVSTVENVEHVGKSSILRLKDEFTPQKYEHVVKFWCEQNTFCSILLNSRSKCGWGLVLKCYRWGSTKWLHSARLVRSKYSEALRSQTDMKRCNTHSFFWGGGIFFIMLTFFVLHFTFLFQFLIQDSFTLYSAFTLTLRNVHLYTK